MAERKIGEDKEMHMPIWLLAIVGVIGFIFLTPYRQGLIDLFSTIWDLICGSAGRLWDFIRGASPAAGTTLTILSYIGMVLMFIALAIILFTAFLYFILGVTIMGIGIATGHTQAALWLLLALTIWGILSVFPSMRGFRTLNWVSRWPVRLVVFALFFYLAITSIWWVFGNISPQLQGSLSRSAENKIEEFSNERDKGSLKSEPEMGKFAKIIEDSQIYSQLGQPVFSVQKGTTVMVKDLDGKKADTDSEGMTKVMCPDRHGDYNKGNEGWIPTRKLDWSWQPKLPPETIKPPVEVPTNISAASDTPRIRQFCWKKREGHAGNGPFREYCSDLISLEIEGDKIRLRVRNGNVGEQILVGERIDDFEFRGTWTQDPIGFEGEWQLRFSPDFQSAVGWQTNKNDPTRIDSWIR